MNTDKMSIIKQIEDKMISHWHIPDEYRNDRDIIFAERKFGLREVRKRGYDVIHNRFFVEEVINGNENWPNYSYFEDFLSYSDYINGEIYENACYYGLDISNINVTLNLDLLYLRKSFTEETINSITPPADPKDIITPVYRILQIRCNPP